MQKIGKNSLEFNNVYLYSTGTVCGIKEYNGPLGAYFDKYYSEPHCGMDSWERAEQQMLKDAINICINKVGKQPEEIDLYVGGDLNNQLVCTNYTLRDFDIPFLGAYAACSTFTESVIIGSTFVESGFAKNVLCSASSHNSTSERQFRYPTEYGGQKPASLTLTATGAGVCLLTNIPTDIKITRGTIGLVVDGELKDANDLGRAMAPAAAETLRNHFSDFEASVIDYDMILTGDLSTFGSNTFLKILDKFDISLGNKYFDSGKMLYDLQTQDVHAGGSGCGCVSLVTLGYIVKAMREEKLKKVLVIATGALMNPIIMFQGETIPSIAHAIVLERVIK